MGRHLLNLEIYKRNPRNKQEHTVWLFAIRHRQIMIVVTSVGEGIHENRSMLKISQLNPMIYS